MVLSQFTDTLLSLLIFMLVVVPILLLWCFALVDLFIRKDIGMGKVIWLIVIVVLPVLGSIIYLLVRPADADLPGDGMAPAEDTAA
jgi:hypothetical protein